MPESDIAIDRGTIAVLERPRRIWVVASVHADAARLARLHREIAARFAAGDRVVYLGNVIGHGAAAPATIDEVLRFRVAVLAGRGMAPADFVMLRGAQEEMWQKLLQLHFALEPAKVLEWMLDQGVAATLAAYGGDARDGFGAARNGAAACARWTAGLRQAMACHPGHRAFMAALRRAAVSGLDTATGEGLLFVNAGIDQSRPLEAQRDSFWWSPGEFGRIDRPYNGFRCVIRGADRRHPGIDVGDYTISIDGGCGFGGPLIGACLTPAGELVERLEV